MINKAKIIFPVVSLLISFQTLAQDTVDQKTVFPSGISLGYGQGSYAVKDEYISKGKYSGSIPYYNVEWVRFQKRNGYRLEFEYWKTTDISNNNISAETQQFNFNQDFIYFVGDFTLFSRKVYTYLGPSVQLFYYEIYYHFVQPGTFIFPTTFGIIGSLGVNTQLIYSISNKFIAEGLLRSNIVSFSGKEYNEDRFANESNPALLSVFTASKLDFDFSLRYYIIKRVSISLGYKFDLSRINKWDPYVAASNNIIFSINFRI